MLKISEEQAQAVLNYLDTKPHREVRGLIDMLVALPKLEAQAVPEAIRKVAEKK